MLMIKNGLRARPRGAARPTPAGLAAPGIDADLARTLAALIAESDLAELEIEKGDLRIKLVRHAAVPVATAPVPAIVVEAPRGAGAAFEAAAPDVPVADHPGAVKSPMVGTVYRRAGPDAKPFVEVGSAVKAGEKLLLVEAMKTFNDIVAPRAGIVAAVLVDDGQPVEYGQPLLVIE